MQRVCQCFHFIRLTMKYRRFRTNENRFCKNGKVFLERHFRMLSSLPYGRHIETSALCTSVNYLKQLCCSFIIDGIQSEKIEPLREITCRKFIISGVQSAIDHG